MGNCSTDSERLQCGGGIVVFRRGKGEVGGGIAKGALAGPVAWLGDDAGARRRLGFGKALQVDEGVGAVVERGWRSIGGILQAEGGEQRLGGGVVLGVEIQPGQEAGDVGVLRVGWR